MAAMAACFRFLGRGEVGKALRQVDGIVLQGQPGHLADDGLGELPRAGGAKTFA